MTAPWISVSPTTTVPARGYRFTKEGVWRAVTRVHFRLLWRSGGGLISPNVAIADDALDEPDDEILATSQSAPKPTHDLRKQLETQRTRDYLIGGMTGVKEVRVDSRKRLEAVEAVEVARIDASNAVSSSLANFRRFSPLFGLSGDETFTLQGEASVAGGKRVLRFEQSFQGVPVLGARMVMRIDAASGVVDRLESNAVAINGLSIRPSINAASAIQAALGSLLAPDAIVQGEPRLAIYRSRGDEPILVWDVPIASTPGLHSSPRFIVDATTGETVAIFERLRRALDRTIWSSNHENPIAPLGYRRYLLCTEGQTCGDSAAAALKPILGDVHQYFDAVFDHDGIDGLGGTVHAAVHMYIDNNALWDEISLTLAFGDGDITFDPTWSDHDFVAHEYMHGVTQHRSFNNLGNAGQAEAIDEGLSDVFAAAFDAYRKGGVPDAATWKWAEGVYHPQPQNDYVPYRHLDRPKLDNLSLDCYPAYVAAPGTDAHYANGILNLAFYLLSNGGAHPSTTLPEADCSNTLVPNIGIANAARAFFDATALFQVDEDYSKLRSHTASAAQNAFGSSARDAVHLAWDAVAVPGSPNVLPLSLPVPPGLTIDSSLCYGVHELAWQAPGEPGGAPTRYEVQFDRYSSFPSPQLVYDGPETSRVITVETSGYFRARACNNAGCATEWRKSMKALYYTTCP